MVGWAHHLPSAYHGAWAAQMPTLRGAWTMGFGISRSLASALQRLGKEGTFNINQEVNLITAAYESGLKVHEVGIEYPPREWECCADKGDARQIYETWMGDPNKQMLPYQFLMHAVKLF